LVVIGRVGKGQPATYDFIKSKKKTALGKNHGWPASADKRRGTKGLNEGLPQEEHEKVGEQGT